MEVPVVIKLEFLWLLLDEFKCSAMICTLQIIPWHRHWRYNLQQERIDKTWKTVFNRRPLEKQCWSFTRSSEKAFTHIEKHVDEIQWNEGSSARKLSPEQVITCGVHVQSHFLFPAPSFSPKNQANKQAIVTNSASSAQVTVRGLVWGSYTNFYGSG